MKGWELFMVHQISIMIFQVITMIFAYIHKQSWAFEFFWVKFILISIINQ